MRSAEDWRYILGTGHWEAVRQLGMKTDDLLRATEGWKRQLDGIVLPWLCWNVDPDWCLIQQKLVVEVGWTPVVGFDPRVGPPPLVPGAICIDFNKEFALPTMWLHFPLEFTFLVADRMAFWHADLLLRRDKMRKVADQFARLPNGTAAAVKPKEGRLAFLSPKKRRYWEVLGCNTRGSSKDQFEKGCGWWMNFWMNPSNNAKDTEERKDYYYDTGSGIRYWHKNAGGRIELIPESYIEEGHFTRIGRKDYVEASTNNFTRNLSKELSLNNNLVQACRGLGIEDLLEPGQP